MVGWKCPPNEGVRCQSLEGGAVSQLLLLHAAKKIGPDGEHFETLLFSARLQRTCMTLDCGRRHACMNMLESQNASGVFNVRGSKKYQRNAFVLPSKVVIHESQAID